MRKTAVAGATRRDPKKVAPYLRVVGSPHRLERVLCHHSTHETPPPAACETLPRRALTPRPRTRLERGRLLLPDEAEGGDRAHGQAHGDGDQEGSHQGEQHRALVLENLAYRGREHQV